MRTPVPLRWLVAGLRVASARSCRVELPVRRTLTRTSSVLVLRDCRQQQRCPSQRQSQDTWWRAAGNPASRSLCPLGRCRRPPPWLPPCTAPLPQHRQPRLPHHHGAAQRAAVVAELALRCGPAPGTGSTVLRSRAALWNRSRPQTVERRCQQWSLALGVRGGLMERPWAGASEAVRGAKRATGARQADQPLLTKKQLDRGLERASRDAASASGRSRHTGRRTTSKLCRCRCRCRRRQPALHGPKQKRKPRKRTQGTPLVAPNSMGSRAAA